MEITVRQYFNFSITFLFVHYSNIISSLVLSYSTFFLNSNIAFCTFLFIIIFAFRICFTFRFIMYINASSYVPAFDLFPPLCIYFALFNPIFITYLISLINSDVLNKWLINFSNGNLITLLFCFI